jgi:hypothetical protein
MFAYFLVSLVALTYAAPDPNKQGCWLQAYGRGVGVPISTCPSGQVVTPHAKMDIKELLQSAGNLAQMVSQMLA